jgi:hypothetical protein
VNELRCEHFYIAHWIAQNVIPVHGCSHDFAQQMTQMVCGFPCEPLLKLLQKILLDFDPRDVTQAMVTKPWNQVLA